MAPETDQQGIRDRIQTSGEDALGRLIQDVLQNPVVTGALGRAFDARERVSEAQEVAMGALNLPSAGDVARLTRRVRSVGQRLEGIEDALDRLEDRLRESGSGGLAERLDAIETTLDRLSQSPAKATPKPASAKVKTGRKPGAKAKPAAKAKAKAKS